MTVWMYLVDHKDHILKGLCHCLFLLRYVRFRVEEERRRSRVGFSDFKAQPALAKAVAEAGLSNYLCTM